MYNAIFAFVVLFLADVQPFRNGEIAGIIFAAKISQQTAALTNQFQQSSAGTVIQLIGA